jgi:hypothetical protein
LEELVLFYSNSILTSKVKDELSQYFREKGQISSESESQGFSRAIKNRIRNYKKKSCEAVRVCLRKTKTKLWNLVGKIPKPVKGAVNFQVIPPYLFSISSVDLIKTNAEKIGCEKVRVLITCDLLTTIAMVNGSYYVVLN